MFGTASRFRETLTTTPGPGEYDVNAAAAAAKKANRATSFGTGARFRSLAEDDTPGPGYYGTDVNVLASAKKISAAMQKAYGQGKCEGREDALNFLHRVLTDCAHVGQEGHRGLEEVDSLRGRIKDQVAKALKPCKLNKDKQTPEMVAIWKGYEPLEKSADLLLTEAAKKHQRSISLLQSVLDDWSSVSSLLSCPDAAMIERFHTLTQQNESFRNGHESYEKMAVAIMSVCEELVEQEKKLDGENAENDETEKVQNAEAALTKLIEIAKECVETKEKERLVRREVARMMAKLEAESANVADAEANFADAQQRIVELEAHLEQEIATLTKTIEEVRSKASEREGELEERHNADYEKYCADLEALLEERDSLELQLNYAREEVALWTKRTEEAEKTHSELSSMVSSLTAEIEQTNIETTANHIRAAEELRVKEAVIAQLEEKIASQEDALSQLEKKEEQVSVELQSTQDHVASLTEQKETLESQVAALQEELATTQAALEEEKEQHEHDVSVATDDANTAAQEYSATIAQLHANIDNLQALHAQVSDELATSSQQVASLTEELSATRSLAENLKSQLDALRQASSSAAAENAERIQQLESDLAASQQLREIQVGNLEQVGEQLRSNLQQATEDATNVRAELESVRDEMARLQAAFGEREMELISAINETAAINDKLNSDLGCAVQEIDNLQQQLQSTSETLEQNTAEFTATKTTMQQQLDSLSVALESEQEKNEQNQDTIKVLSTELETEKVQASATIENLETEKEQLSATVAKLGEELESLSEDFSEEKQAKLLVEKEKEQLFMDLEVSHASIASLGEELSNLEKIRKEEQDSWEGEKTELQSQVESLADEKTKLETLREEEQEEYARTMEEHANKFSSLEAELAAEKEQHVSTKEQLETSLAKCEDLQSQITKLEGEVASTAASLVEREDQVESLQKAIKCLRETSDIAVSKLQSDLAKLESDLAAEKQAAIELNQQWEEKMEQHEKQTAEELIAIQQQGAATIAAIKEDIQDKQKEIDTKSAMLVVAESEIAQLREDLNVEREAAYEMRVSLTTQLEEQTKFAAEEKNALEEEAAAAITAARDVVEQKEREIADKLAEIEACSVEITQLQSKIVAAEEQLAEEERIHAEARKEMAIIVSEFQSFQHSTSEALAAEEQKREEAEAVAEAAKKEVATVMAQNAAVEQHIRQLEVTMHDSLEQLKQTHEEEEKRLIEIIEDLKSQLEIAEHDKQNAEELASEMYNSKLGGGRVSEGGDDVVCAEQEVARLRGRVEALEAQLAESLDEKEEWLAEMHRLRQSEQDAVNKYEAHVEGVERLHETVKALENSNRVLEAEVTKLTAENVKLVGHSNMKQKVQYHAKVKEENNNLKKVNAKLSNDADQYIRMIQRLKREILKISGGEKENIDFDEEERLAAALRRAEEDARDARTHLHSLASQISLIVSQNGGSSSNGNGGNNEETENNVLAMSSSSVFNPLANSSSSGIVASSSSMPPPFSALLTPNRSLSNANNIAAAFGDEEVLFSSAVKSSSKRLVFASNEPSSRDSLTGQFPDEYMDDQQQQQSFVRAEENAARHIAELADKCNGGLQLIAAAMKKQQRAVKDNQMRIQLLERESKILKNRQQPALVR